MKYATISSKRQIALPKDILEDLGINVKDKVRVEKSGESIKVTPIKKSVTDELSGILADRIPEDKKGASWETIMEETTRLAAKDLAEK